MTEVQKTLIESNLKLVYHMAWKLERTDFVSRNMDDLTQEGMIGLLKAANAFDPGKGIKFATFASRCIHNAMLMFIRRNKKHESNISLYSVIGNDTEGRELLLLDTIVGVENEIDRIERAACANSDLHELNTRMTIRERKIIGFIRHEMTQRAMAAELGLSQSYISRLIKIIRGKYKRQNEDCGSG